MEGRPFSSFPFPSHPFPFPLIPSLLLSFLLSLPFLPFLSPLFSAFLSFPVSALHMPCLPLEVGPFKSSKWVWGSTVSSQNVGCRNRIWCILALKCMISDMISFNYFPQSQLTKNATEQELGAPPLGGPLDSAYPIATPLMLS